MPEEMIVIKRESVRELRRPVDIGEAGEEGVWVAADEVDEPTSEEELFPNDEPIPENMMTSPVESLLKNNLPFESNTRPAGRMHPAGHLVKSG